MAHMMAPLAKRPRRSEDYDSGVYYDNVPGTSMTRTAAGPSSVAGAAAAYLAPYTTGGANGTATSPLLTSRLSARSLGPASASNNLSSGAEDNAEDMAPPKSSSTQGARGRGRGRGRGRPRGRPRGSTLHRTTVDVASYSDEPTYPLVNGHTAPLDPSPDDADTPTNPLTFQCRSCYRLLGDSFSFVATDTELGYVILSDVSDVVVQDTTFSTSTNPGKDLGSTFARLRCAGCNATVGRNYRTTPRDLDDLRDCFSLEVSAIRTYQLGSNHTDQLAHDEPSTQNRPNAQSLPLEASSALESKMERTRALTIELSDRLIKAEEDIRRYSAQVSKLLQEKAEAEATPARLPLVEEETPAVEEVSQGVEVVLPGRIAEHDDGAEAQRKEVEDQQEVDEPATSPAKSPTPVKEEPQPRATRPATRTRRSAAGGLAA